MQKKEMKPLKENKLKVSKGITLIALVVTIIVLLILAGVSITVLWGDNGILKTAGEAANKFEIAQAREKLEVTFGHAQMLKHTDSKYNQDDYLDDLMKKEIPNIKIQDDIVIVDEFAFSIDRSVPKVGEYIGREDELVFPEISISEVTLAEDYKTATFTITAKEEQNGISKIEILQNGQVIEEFNYDNVTTPINQPYATKRNGIYTVKVYSKLTGTQRVKVQDLVMDVKFTPNGEETYKKAHNVVIEVKEDTDRLKSLKYQWTKELKEPAESSFTQVCSNNGTVTGDKITGTYYLWILLETESGKKNLCCSEAFNFDNEGPQVELASTPISETSLTLTAKANDVHSEIARYEFYVGNNEVRSI